MPDDTSLLATCLSLSRLCCSSVLRVVSTGMLLLDGRNGLLLGVAMAEVVLPVLSGLLADRYGLVLQSPVVPLIASESVV